MAQVELNKKLRRDSVHKKSMLTKRRLEDNENFSAGEAMRYAVKNVKKRKCLIQDVTGTLSDCELELDDGDDDDNDDIDDDNDNNDENDDGAVWILRTGFIWAYEPLRVTPISHTNLPKARCSLVSR